jgi:hypothetical protein
MATEKRRVTRRNVLIGLAGAGAVASAGGLAYGLTQILQGDGKPVTEVDLLSVFIDQPVPAADPDSALWEKAEAVEVALTGQTVILPFKQEPAVQAVSVRSLHDGQTIAFRMEWADPQKDEHSIKTGQFRDACGVMLGPYPAPAALWTMGTPETPVTILHWRADWQLDIDAGFQDLEVAFPNVAFDFYPPLAGAQHPLKLPDAYPEDARMWLPGWSVGNPLSQPVKKTPVQKLIGIGPGTLEAPETQNAVGKGVWKDNRWKIVLARPLSARDDQETALAPGGEYSLAFAVWSGADSDVGARKSLTQLGRLRVQATS